VTKAFLWGALLFFAMVPATGQVRWYVTAGTSFNSSFDTKGFYTQQFGNSVWTRSGSYTSHPVGRYFSGDLQAEFPVNKLIYGVTGLSFFQLGYSNYDSYSRSEFECTYLGVPLLLRVNFVQAVLLDVGAVARFPVSAKLYEEALAGTQWYKTAEGDIAGYLNPVSLGLELRVAFLFNRYSAGLYMMTGKVNVHESFKEEWGLNGAYSAYSLFQEDMFPTYSIFTAGLQIGMRL
jgi:hypothetical protein